MIDKEMLKALRKAGLADVCLYNGKWMFNDGRELSAEQAALVEQIARADTPLKKAAKASPAQPAHTKKPAAGKPKAGGKT